MVNKNELLIFLENQSISFETLIRSFNFWNGLTVSERVSFIRMFEQGHISKSGLHSCNTGSSGQSETRTTDKK